MKKTFTTLLAVLLMISSILTKTDIKAETETKVPTYKTYTFIGDSIAAGHSLADYNSYADGHEKSIYQEEYNTSSYGDGHLIKESYAQLVYDAVKAENVNCLAMSGFSTASLRYMLDDSYEMDETTTKFLSWATEERYTTDGYEAFREPYKEAIKNSDLITIGVGSNDYLYGFIAAFSRISTLISQNSEMPTETFGQRVSKKFSQLASLFKVIKYVLDSLDETYDKLTENWDTTIELIRKLNPDAKIVVVGLYNPMRDMTLSKDSKIKVGKLANSTIKKVNKFFEKKAKTRNEYTYVDVGDVEVYECFTVQEAASFDSNFFKKLANVIHPTPAGHKYIADKIIAALAQ